MFRIFPFLLLVVMKIPARKSHFLNLDSGHNDREILRKRDLRYAEKKGGDEAMAIKGVLQFFAPRRGALQHCLNALHVYCRLRDLGMPKPMARWIAQRIEPVTKLIYAWG